ncbi:MAG: hypothetical protein CMP07_05735 [Xanthomonadales bacterium]|nr:hypothetical protein [Xanthomonadales bacterium]
MMHSFARAPIIDRSAGLPALRPVIATLGAALMSLLLTACEPAEQAVAIDSTSARPVRVAEARIDSAGERIRLPGALRPRQRAEMAFLDDGTLQQRHVQLGARVTQGEQLATLYNPALQPGLAGALADVREAGTRLEQLETDTRRQATLVERDLISEDDLEQTRTRRDAARAALEQAEARLDQARAQLDDAALRAPFDGRIARFYAEPGDSVRAGQPVMMLAGDELEVEVQLPPETAARLSVGDPADILLQDRGLRLGGRVHEMGRGVPGAPVPVVVALSAEDALDTRSGAPVYVILELPATSTAAVPLAAVVDPGTGYGRIFRVVDGRAEEVSVQLGRLADGWVDVFGPVAEGDRIVVAGQSNLLDGEPVRIVR